MIIISRFAMTRRTQTTDVLHWIRRDFSFVGAGAKYRVLTAADCAPTLITMRLLLPETFMQRYKTILLIVQFLCLRADFVDLQFIGHKDCFLCDGT